MCHWEISGNHHQTGIPPETAWLLGLLACSVTEEKILNLKTNPIASLSSFLGKNIHINQDIANTL